MSQIAEDFRPSALQALQEHRWRDAYDLLDEADRDGSLKAEDLETLADAAWWSGKHSESVGARERAFNAYTEVGEEALAGRMALELYREYIQRGDVSIAGAWFSRAERIFADLPESEHHGYLHLSKAFTLLDMKDVDGAIAAADEIIRIGDHFGNKDLQAFGLTFRGRGLIEKGEVREGLNLIDEGAVAAVSGDLSPFATGMIYCLAISQCRELADYRRAGEWTEAAKRWCERQSINGFPGVCRVHRAEIMALRGDWAAAEQEARQASDELVNFNMAFIAADGVYEIGEIRLRMGDLPAAEQAFTQAHEMGASPQPGMALLRKAQGNPAAASASIKRALDEETNPLRRVRLLPVAAELAIDEGDIGSARRAAEEAQAIAEQYGSVALRATALCARGAVELAEGDAASAIRTVRESLQAWQKVEAPFEMARCRMVLGAAYRALGDEDGAVLELKAAKVAFERLGAMANARAVAALLGEEGGVAYKVQDRVTKTFMFTDIMGSTSLLEAIGDEAWEALIEWHDQALRSLIAGHAGEEIRHAGDGFVVAFSDPTSAIDCAVAIQRKLAGHRKESGFSPQVRIGLHLSEATRRGLDYSGKGIHEAARIGGIAGGGEILVSRATLEASRATCRTSDPQQVSLKGIAEPVEVVQVEWR